MDYINIATALVSIFISIITFLSIGWKAWASITTTVNNFGQRLNRAERDVASHDAEINSLRNELRSERDLLVTTMHNNERAAAERHAQLQVQFARLEERLDVEKLVSSIAKAMLK